MAASGGWVEFLIEFGLRALFGVLKAWHEDWWPYGCLVAAFALTVCIFLIVKQRRARRARPTDHQAPD